ncbi:MAG TPA: hypothetical protein VN085_03770 [Vicinamibacterales bacterium]|jgi:hypothetical protein|nr:hypothetical protein [Vicinamibacterales bacterium]
MITQQQLDGYLGKSIAQICQNGYTNPHDNHCAHFVSHVLGCHFGVTCQMMGKANAPAATLRVQELFQRCHSVGAWSLRPSSLKACLVFITRASNVNLANRSMVNVPRKHVGIYVDGSIWHYSNAQQKVVRQLPAQFAQHYPAPDNRMFFGTLP